MELRLILSTFLVIFLAELGDKTQLAAMAASAGSNQPWSILLGASLALIVSSALAVLAGKIIGTYIPMKYIKLAAGAVFLLFGALYIKDAFIPEKPEEVKKSVSTSAMGSSVIRAARAFEREELNMLRAIRRNINDETCQTALDSIIKDEEEHLKNLSDMKKEGTSLTPKEKVRFAPLQKKYACEDEESLLSDLYDREAAMADFYRLMSEKTKIPAAQQALRALHSEELAHAERIAELLKKSG